MSPALLAEDALVFGLRMNSGVDLAPWRARAPELPWSEVDALLLELEATGRVTRSGHAVRLTPAGRLVADAIGAELLTAFASEEVAA